MKALIDSGVRWRRYHGLPLHPRLRATLGQVTEWYLCPLSIEEMLYKWRHKPQMLPAPDPRLSPPGEGTRCPHPFIIHNSSFIISPCRLGALTRLPHLIHNENC